MANLNYDGYELVKNVYSESEINAVLQYLSLYGRDNQYGVRRFLKKNPSLLPLILNEKLLDRIAQISNTAQVVRSLYFDKPPTANWVVQWHQDLTIEVKEKRNLPGFTHWRKTEDRTVVQPPIEVLQNLFTVRVHLDDCTSKNGALRVVRGSHLKGILNLADRYDDILSNEVVCEAQKGDVLIMKPLLIHSSKRTENSMNRRVIHIEFSDMELPDGLEWAEAQRVCGSVKSK